jgi:hypothetical protein
MVSKETPNRDKVLDELLHEIRRIKSVFRAAKLDAKIFRRRLRMSAADRELGLSNPDQIHRSKAAKKVFADAERLAALVDSNVYPAHLLYAVLLAEDDKRDGALAEIGIPMNDLQDDAKREVLYQGRTRPIMSSRGRGHRN